MADSFAGRSLNVRTTPLGRAQPADVTVAHIPGGSNSFVDLAGQLPRRLQLGLFHLDDADYLALEGLVQTQATLSYVQGTYTAVLLSLTLTRRYNGGVCESTAEFLLV